MYDMYCTHHHIVMKALVFKKCLINYLYVNVLVQIS